MEAFLLIGQFEGKECSARVSSRQWGGALRDDPKNGCVGD